MVQFWGIGRVVFAALLNVAACSTLAAQGNEMNMPLPRDPEIAVREEFEMAERSNTPEAWQRFISRHAGHALAEAAEKRLKVLQRKAN